MLQELRGCQLLAVTQLNHFGDILHDVNHLHLLVKPQSVLRVISETYGLSDIQRTAIGLHLSHQYLYKSRLTRTVVPNNPHLFVTGKDVREIFQYLQVTETLIEMIGFKYLTANVGSLHLQFHIVVVKPLFGYFLQFVESIFTIPGFMSAGLRHTAHPIQLGTI